MAPFVGRLVNAFGERVLLATGIGIVAVSSLLAGLSQSYWQLLVLRGAGGVGSIMFSVSAASLLVRVTPDHLRGRAQGVWAGSFLIGIIAGPAVGTVARFSLRAPFFLYAGTLVGRRRARPRRTPAQRTRSAPQVPGGHRHAGTRAAQPRLPRPRSPPRSRGFRARRVALGDLPQFVIDRLHLGTGWAYAAFLVVSLVSGALLLPIGRSPTPAGAVRSSSAGCWSVRSGSSPAGCAGRGGLLVAAVLLGVAGAADSVAPGAVMGDVVAGRGGTVVAVFQMAGDLGAVLGPVVAGAIADGGGYG